MKPTDRDRGFRCTVSSCFFLAVLTATGCSRSATQATRQPTDVVAAAIEADVFAEFGRDAETIAVAKSAGHDYLRTLCRCLLRDRQAMHELLEMTTTCGFDAASGEGHSAALGYVLRDVGDRFFGTALAVESASVQVEVREQLLFDLGYGNTSVTLEEIRHLYPKTFPAESLAGIH